MSILSAHQKQSVEYQSFIKTGRLHVVAPRFRLELPAMIALMSAISGIPLSDQSKANLRRIGRKLAVFPWIIE